MIAIQSYRRKCSGSGLEMSEISNMDKNFSDSTYIRIFFSRDKFFF